jgi:hypothetical protein
MGKVIVNINNTKPSEIFAWSHTFLYIYWGKDVWKKLRFLFYFRNSYTFKKILENNNSKIVILGLIKCIMHIWQYIGFMKWN